MEKDRVLNFADLCIRRLDNSFIMKVYRKETHTNRYINWKSNEPTTYKIGTMKTLIHGAYDLCTLEIDREEEIEFLKDTFIANDFPIETVDSVFSKYIPDKYEPETLKGEQDNKPPIIFVNVIIVPLIQGFSNKLKKELQKEQISIMFGKDNTLETQLCKLKSRTDIMDSKEVIYMKECSNCCVKCISETGQTLKERDILHKSDIKTGKERSAIYTHISNNKGHKIDWENQTIIDKENNFIKRRMKVFYPDIRKSIRKNLKNSMDSKEVERSMGAHIQK